MTDGALGLLERVTCLDTASVSDALDKHGISGQCLGIKPLSPSFRLCGFAYTVRYCSVDVADPGTVGDYIDKVGKNDVVVIDNGGRPDATVWGDILTFLADQKGVAGTVIEGACRDVSLSLELKYPIYSRSYSMRTGKDRVQFEAEQVAITIGGARVSPGDLIVGDANGVVCIPIAMAETVISTAESITAAEDRIRELLKKGRSLAEARQAMNYHSLQTREK